jgi:rhamnulokinase
VLAGPVEASATGNVLVQAIAGGTIADLAAGRALVHATAGVRRHDPRAAGAPGQAARERFAELVAARAD